MTNLGGDGGGGGGGGSGLCYSSLSMYSGSLNGEWAGHKIFEK